mmetsp:Transcript_116175/g.324906  ORF Transcript_116175/g.324906 Transcript_116175/m.324906 type:complete len:250 (-) Transcript_116175:368-1117(-)
MEAPGQSWPAPQRSRRRAQEAEQSQPMKIRAFLPFLPYRARALSCVHALREAANLEACRPNIRGVGAVFGGAKRFARTASDSACLRAASASASAPSSSASKTEAIRSFAPPASRAATASAGFFVARQMRPKWRLTRRHPPDLPLKAAPGPPRGKWRPMRLRDATACPKRRRRCAIFAAAVRPSPGPKGARSLKAFQSSLTSTLRPLAHCRNLHTSVRSSGCCAPGAGLPLTNGFSNAVTTEPPVPHKRR